MCGVIGLQLKESSQIAEWAKTLLMRLQHRGQDGAGITVLNNEGDFESLRGLGLVAEALHDVSRLHDGRSAIAHTRYATTGLGGVAEVQPFVKGAPKLAMAHNGNIINSAELIEKHSLICQSTSDLEVLQQLYMQRKQVAGFEAALQFIFDELNGSYAVAGLEDEGRLFGFRDPFGIRPLFLAESNEVIALASETSALSMIPNAKISEVSPGEWVEVDNFKLRRGFLRSKRNPSGTKKYCMFENVYFSSPQSEIDHKSVYRLRFRLGEELASEIINDWGGVEKIREQIDYVVPVPDTSRSAALAVAERLGIPYREYLVKSNYVSRTFILSRQEQRMKALNQKLSLIGPEINGFRILFVDDSVVRGNTSKLMATRLREAGAKRVYLASTCPPIRHGCFYGIDFPDPDELVAYKRDENEIATELGVDRINYLSLAGLKKAFATSELCTACLDGEYPTFDSSFERFLLERRRDRATDSIGDGKC